MLVDLPRNDSIEIRVSAAVEFDSVFEWHMRGGLGREGEGEGRGTYFSQHDHAKINHRMQMTIIRSLFLFSWLTNVAGKNCNGKRTSSPPMMPRMAATRLLHERRRERMEGAVRSETGIKQVMSDPRKCVCRVRAYVRACGRACARACSVRARGVCAYAVGVFDTFEIVFATRALY